MRFPFIHHTPRFILMVGDDAVLLTTQNAPPIFAAHGNAQGIAHIMETLAQHPSAPLTILLDTLAQDFRPQSLPPLSWFDRRPVMRRRLAEAFSGRLFSTSIMLSVREGMLINLHDTPTLQGWLQRVAQRCPALCLLPWEAVAMLQALSTALHIPPQGWHMLLSLQESGGVRQIITRDGKLILTRLTPPLHKDTSAEDAAENLRRDIAASRGYLARLGLRDHDILHIVALLPESLSQALSTLNAPQDHIHPVTPQRAATLLNLNPTTDEIFADTLYAAWCATHRPRLRLWLPAIQKLRQTNTINKILRHGAALSLLLMLGTLLYHGIPLAQLAFTNHALRNDVFNVENQTAEQQRRQPNAMPNSEQRAAREVMKFYTAPTVTPWPMINALATALPKNTRLEHLQWHDDEHVGFTLHRAASDTPETLEQDLSQVMPDYRVNLAPPTNGDTNDKTSTISFALQRGRL